MAIIKTSASCNRAFIIHKDETAPIEQIEGNKKLLDIAFNMLKPQPGASSSNLSELILSIKEASILPQDIGIGDIEDMMTRPRQIGVILKYVIVDRKIGTVLGFYESEKDEIVELVIPRFTGLNCLIEVYASDNDTVSCYVDCTNRKIFMPEEIGRI